jgi:predicted HTH domain antitoxin
MKNSLTHFRTFRSAAPLKHAKLVLMKLVLDIPSALTDLMSEIAEQELKQDLAVGMYSRGRISLGKASELADMKRLDFEQLLCEQHIVRHYSEEDLEHDIEWGLHGARTNDKGEMKDPI